MNESELFHVVRLSYCINVYYGIGRRGALENHLNDMEDVSTTAIKRFFILILPWIEFLRRGIAPFICSVDTSCHVTNGDGGLYVFSDLRWMTKMMMLIKFIGSKSH